MLRLCEKCDYREYLHCDDDPDQSGCRNNLDKPWFKPIKYPAKTCKYYLRWNPIRGAVCASLGDSLTYDPTHCKHCTYYKERGR